MADESVDFWKKAYTGENQTEHSGNRHNRSNSTILGVQGLSYQNYSVLELKIVLQIIKHAQKAILGYVIPCLLYTSRCV